MSGQSGYGYRVRVADVSDGTEVDCSEEFRLMPSEDAPEVGDEPGPYLVVTSPGSDDNAEAGVEYTVEVKTRRKSCTHTLWLVGVSAR